MKRILHISILASIALLVGSCMVQDADMYADFEAADFSGVTGIITDMEDNPIEHLKITLNIEGESENHVSYTSSEGIFATQIDFAENFDTVVLNIKIEDFDKEENGGLFESKTDRIIIDRELYQDPVRVEVSYRLSHATVSESNPQS